MFEKQNLKIYKNIYKLIDGIPQNEIVKNSDMSVANFSKFINKLKKGQGITTDSLFNLAKVLKVDAAELLK